MGTNHSQTFTGSVQHGLIKGGESWGEAAVSAKEVRPGFLEEESWSKTWQNG